MKKIIVIAVAMVSLGLVFGAETTDNLQNRAVKIPTKGDFHIYVLMGQSNMSGRGEIKPVDKVGNPRILMLDKDDKWQIAVDPLHFDRPHAAVGLGMSFAGEMLKDEKTGLSIGLVPCAVGGSPLKKWEKGGDLYVQALDRIEKARKIGTLKGVLWHQGETDSVKLEWAKSYQRRLEKMIGDFRDALGQRELVFVVGTLGDYFKGHKKFVYTELVNHALVKIAEDVNDVGCVYSTGLTDNDGVHFDRPSQIELGRRYARKMREILNAKKN